MNQRDASGNTSLHFCCANGHGACAQLLLTRGADVNACNARGDTPLHNAARWGFPGLVRALLDAGANAEARNQADRLPEHEARLAEIVKELSARRCGVTDLAEFPDVQVRAAPASHAYLQCTFVFAGLDASRNLSDSVERRAAYQSATEVVGGSDKLAGKLLWLAYDGIGAVCRMHAAERDSQARSSGRLV